MAVAGDNGKRPGLGCFAACLPVIVAVGRLMIGWMGVEGLAARPGADTRTTRKMVSLSSETLIVHLRGCPPARMVGAAAVTCKPSLEVPLTRDVGCSWLDAPAPTMLAPIAAPKAARHQRMTEIRSE